MPLKLCGRDLDARQVCAFGPLIAGHTAADAGAAVHQVEAAVAVAHDGDLHVVAGTLPGQEGRWRSLSSLQHQLPSVHG